MPAYDGSMPRRGRPPHPDVLTPREWDVLAVLREGASNEDIAERLEISLATAKFHVSEIISKLGVRNRIEAARWQPGGERRMGVLPALSALLRPSTIALAGGVTVVGAAVGLVVLLTWGVIAQRGDSVDADSPVPPAVTRHLSVLEFDVDAGTVARLDFGRDLAFVQWVEDREVVVGYDGELHAYVALHTNGALIRTVFEQPDDGTLDAWLAPQRDGRRVMVYWEGRDAFSSLDVITGEWENFTQVNGVSTGPQFSPDGSKMAYNNRQESTSAATTIPAFGYSLIEREGLVFAQIPFGEDVDLGLLPDAWSPDSRYVLAAESELAGFCGVDCREFGRRTYRVYDLSLTNSFIWERTLDRLTGLQWAGPERLYAYQPEITTEGGEVRTATAEFIDVRTGEVSAVVPTLGCCVLSFSPDGRYAITRSGDGPASEHRCALVEVRSGDEIAALPATPADDGTGFCSAVSWTADGSAALVSVGGH